MTATFSALSAIKIFFRSLALRNFVRFRGRASRREFWSFWCVTALLYALFFALFFVEKTVAGSLLTIHFVATSIPMLASAVRRLHDTDRSGWWVGGILLLNMTSITMQNRGFMEPAYGFSIAGAILGLVVLFLLTRPGRTAPNRFGNPEPAL